VFLLGISLWIRLRLNESPIFQRMKEEATTSRDRGRPKSRRKPCDSGH
jgi:hypothetical protein